MTQEIPDWVDAEYTKTIFDAGVDAFLLWDPYCTEENSIGEMFKPTYMTSDKKYIIARYAFEYFYSATCRESLSGKVMISILTNLREGQPYFDFEGLRFTLMEAEINEIKRRADCPETTAEDIRNLALCYMFKLIPLPGNLDGKWISSLFRKAAEQGDKLAIYYLAIREPDQDDIQKKAADIGSMKALTYLMEKKNDKEKEIFLNHISRVWDKRNLLVTNGPLESEKMHQGSDEEIDTKINEKIEKEIENSKKASNEVMLCSLELPTEVIAIVQDNLYHLAAASLGNFLLPTHQLPPTPEEDKKSSCTIS